MSRAKGTRKPCDVQQARQRLVGARRFLEAAKLLDTKLATAFKRALDRKTQAGYESVDISAGAGVISPVTGRAGATIGAIA